MGEADLLALLKEAGPYALAIVFAYMWRLERAERLTTLERLIKNMADMNAAWLEVLDKNHRQEGRK